MKNILSKIKIDNSTYLLLLLALLAGYIKSLFIILIIILIHEIGHVFFFTIFKIEVESIIIYPFGGITKINNRLHERIYKDVLISLGGVLFQILLWMFFYLLYKRNLIVLNTYQIFKMYNLSIIIFNLIPIVPLDGSKLFFTFCTKFLAYRTSYIFMIVLGVISLILFIVYNFIYRLNDIVVYIFLISELYLVIKEFKFIMNKFYLERIMYDNYYDEIIYNCKKLENIRIDKFYYFKDKNRYLNEKEFIKLKRY